jgi:hypothetical protein
LSEYIPVELRRKVREHFADCCADCQTTEQLTVVTFELEHITPISANGPTIFENLCLSCPTCNRRKSDRTLGIDPATGIAVRLFHPHRDRWKDHFAWTDEADRIIAATPTGRATIEVLGMNRQQLIRARRLWVALGEHPPTFDR